MYKSLVVFDLEQLENYVGETRDSLFFQYIAKRPPGNLN